MIKPELNYFDTPDARRTEGNFTADLMSAVMKDRMNRRAKEITDEKIRQYNEAVKSGNFGKANAIKNELINLWNVDGDFESTFEPKHG